MSRSGNRRGRGQDRTGRSKRDGQWFALPYKMIQSNAFRSLNGASLKVFLELRSRFHGSNNGRLHLSQQECARLLNISKSTAGRAFKELEEKGFIVKIRQGYFTRGLATEWQVTDQKYNDQPASRDWEAWRPPHDCQPRKTKRRCPNGPMLGFEDPPPYRGPKA